MKKKAKAKGQQQQSKSATGGGDDDDEDAEGGDKDKNDDILVNPNRVKKKLNIADIDAPRELSRKEREAKEKKEAQDRYWKVRIRV